MNRGESGFGGMEAFEDKYATTRCARWPVIAKQYADVKTVANIEAAASQAAGIRGDLHTGALSHKLWSYEDLPQRRHVQHARLRPAALAEVRRCSFNVDQDEAELGAALLLLLLVIPLSSPTTRLHLHTVVHFTRIFERSGGPLSANLH